MMRTQIQLPDRLHRRLKQVAECEETSLAEIMRRASEYYLAVHPQFDDAPRKWVLPTAVDMGPILVDEAEWRELGNEPTEADLLERVR